MESYETEKLKGEITGVSPFPLDPSLAPLLLFDQHDGDASGDDTIFLYSIPKRQLLARRADGFRGHRYWLTPQGWVLMLHLESHNTFLWNPSTLERISLPLDHENLLQAVENGRFLLSLRPTDPDCVVLMVDLAREDKVIYYCHTGGNQWFKHEHEHASFDTECLTMLGGKFYAFDSRDEQIVTLEFLPYPAFNTRGLLRHPGPIGYIKSDSRILECRGELFIVGFSYQGPYSQHVARISVHKLDLSRGDWLQVNTLADMVFFFDSSCRGYGASFNARQLSLTEGDRIYFLTSDGKALYVYDMRKGTTAMHNPGPALQDSFVPQFVMPSV